MNATVLFADVSGAAISHCIEPLRKAAESAGGRVVKLVGDEVMVLFASPDAAAKAAVKMHQCIEALPAAAGDEPALRVAFHSGPVIQVDKDVLGDTVKLAARLVAQAQSGQTITSGQTAAQLSPGLRPFSGDLRLDRLRPSARRRRRGGGVLGQLEKIGVRARFPIAVAEVPEIGL